MKLDTKGCLLKAYNDIKFKNGRGGSRVLAARMVTLAGVVMGRRAPGSANQFSVSVWVLLT